MLPVILKDLFSGRFDPDTQLNCQSVFLANIFKRTVQWKILLLEIMGKRTRYRVENVDWTGSFLSINLDRMVSRKQQWHNQRAVRKGIILEQKGWLSIQGFIKGLKKGQTFMF